MQTHKNPGKQLIQAVALVSTSEYSSQLVTLSRGPPPWPEKRVICHPDAEGLCAASGGSGLGWEWGDDREGRIEGFLLAGTVLNNARV